MNMFLDIAKATWQLVTFPWIFLILIVLSFAWLWLEKQLTRVGRATPGIRGPLPFTTLLSSIAIFLIIWGKRLLYLWGILYVGSTIIFFLANKSADFPSNLVEITYKIDTYWHNIYALLAKPFS